MSKALWPIVGIVITLVGCGEPGGQPGPAATHGGMMIGLPDDKGFVEIVTRDSTAGGKPGQQVVVYFFDSTKIPMTALPSSATLRLRGSRGAKPIELKPGEAGTMESPPIPAIGDFEGQLMLTMDGKPVTLTIGGR